MRLVLSYLSLPLFFLPLAALFSYFSRASRQADLACSSDLPSDGKADEVEDVVLSPDVGEKKRNEDNADDASCFNTSFGPPSLLGSAVDPGKVLRWAEGDGGRASTSSFQSA